MTLRIRPSKRFFPLVWCMEMAIAWFLKHHSAIDYDELIYLSLSWSTSCRLFFLCLQKAHQIHVQSGSRNGGTQNLSLIALSIVWRCYFSVYMSQTQMKSMLLPKDVQDGVHNIRPWQRWMSRENEKGHEHSIASFGAVMQLTCKNNFKLGKHYGKVNVDTRFTAYN